MVRSELEELVDLAFELWPPPKTRSRSSAGHRLAALLNLGSASEIAAYLRVMRKGDNEQWGYPLAVACQPDSFRAWLRRRRMKAVDAQRHDAPRHDAPDQRARAAEVPAELARAIEKARAACGPQAPVRTLPGPEAQPTTKTRLGAS